MTTEQFKQYLRDNKSKLKGRRLNVSYNGDKKWFTSLQSFGDYLLSILKPTSYCIISNNYSNAFTVFDKEPSNEIPTLTEKQIQAGISNTLKRWGTTV